MSAAVRPAVHVARGASVVIVNRIVNMLVSVAAFAIIARIISRDEMGGLGVLGLVASVAQLIAGLGIGSTATRFVSSLESSGDGLNARRAGYECLVINCFGSLVMVSVIIGLSDSLALFLLGSASRGDLLRLLSLEVGAIGINYSLVSILTGLKKFKELSFADTSTFIARQALVVIFLEVGWGLSGVVLGWGIGDVLSSILLIVYTRKFLGPPAIGFGFRKLLAFSAPLLLGESVTYVWGWFDKILLVPLVSLAQFGAYNVAVTAFVFLSSLPGGISATLFPYYTRFYKEHAREKTRDLENAVKTASRYVSFFTIPIAVGMAATSLPAVTLLAGNNYVDAALPLAILSISLAIACQVRALSQIFVVLGRTITSALVTSASIAISVIVGVVMIEDFGIMGGSVARGISMIIALVISIQILRGIMKLRFDMRAYGLAWAASLAMAGAVLFLQIIIYSKYLLPLYAAVGAAIYIIVLRFTHAVNGEDLDLLSEFLGRRLSLVTKWLGIILDV